MRKKGYEFFVEFNIFLKVNKLLNRGIKWGEGLQNMFLLISCKVQNVMLLKLIYISQYHHPIYHLNIKFNYSFHITG